MKNKKYTHVNLIIDLNEIAVITGIEYNYPVLFTCNFIANLSHEIILKSGKVLTIYSDSWEVKSFFNFEAKDKNKKEEIYNIFSTERNNLIKKYKVYKDGE